MLAGHWKSGSLGVWVEDLYMDCRVVPCACHRLPRLISLVRLQVVHQLHGGGVGCQLQCSLAAGLQLKGNVDSPVDGQAQTMDTYLSVTSAFQQLLTSRQLSTEVSFHVHIDVVASFGQFPRKAFPQGVLHWVHLNRGVHVCVSRGCLRHGRHT